MISPLNSSMASTTDIHAVQLSPSSSSSKIIPWSGPVDPMPGTWQRNCLLVAEPRCLFPLATSFRVLPVDLLYPTGIRPKLNDGERPCICRCRAITTHSSPFRRGVDAVGRGATEVRLFSNCLSAHSAGTKVWGSFTASTVHKLPLAYQANFLALQNRPFDPRNLDGFAQAFSFGKSQLRLKFPCFDQST